MVTGLEYVLETIKVKGDTIEGDDFLTNALLIDDILVALGYNKRREMGVIELKDEPVQWEIKVGDEKRAVMLVYGYKKAKRSAEELSGAVKYAEQNGFEYLLATNGERITVYKGSKELVTVDSIFENEQDDVIKALSNKGWSKEFFDKYNVDESITDEKVRQVVNEKIDTVVNIVLEALNIDGDAAKAREKVKSILSSWVYSGNVDTSGVEKQAVAGTDASGIEGDYRRKVIELETEKQKLEESVREYKETIAKLEKSIGNEDDTKLAMAEQLLSAVEDNEDLNRAYVGVVNTKLFQISELNKFVGTCLQELYNDASFELLPLLFDGDIFKLRQPAVRNDIMVNGKKYDLDLSGLSEDEVLKRIKTLFSKFDNAVFMCKTIGTPVETVVIEEESLEEFEGSFDVGIEEPVGLEGTLDESIEEPFDDSSFRRPEPMVEVVSNEEGSVGAESVLELPLASVSAALWLDDSNIDGVYAVSNNQRAFKINNSSFESIVNECVKTFIGLSECPMETLRLLSEYDVSSETGFVHLGKEKDADFKLFGTNYFVSVDNIKKCISLVVVLGEILVPSGTITVYLNANTESAASVYGDLDYNIVNTARLELFDQLDTSGLQQVEGQWDCIISNDRLDMISVEPEVESLMDKMIEEAWAARAKQWKQSIKTKEKLAETVQIMIESSEFSEQEVSGVLQQLEQEGFGLQMVADGEGSYSYEVVDTKPYEVIKLLMRMNALLNNNSKLFIRAKLNTTLYKAFESGNVRCSGSEYLAGKLIVDMLSDRVKQLDT